MGLSCECYEWEGEGFYYTVKSRLLNEEPIIIDGKEVWDQEFFFPLATRRARRCCSCKNLIRVGEPCIEFKRHVSTEGDDIKERIHGDEMQIASWFHCEKCGEQYLNLEGLGYCIDISENMFALLDEYKELHDVSVLI